DANGPGPQENARRHLSLAQDEYIKRIIVGAVRSRNKAVICRVMDGAIENAVHPQQAGRLVQLVLDFRPSRDFDENRKPGVEVSRQKNIMPGMCRHGSIPQRLNERQNPWSRATFSTALLESTRAFKSL